MMPTEITNDIIKYGVGYIRLKIILCLLIVFITQYLQAVLLNKPERYNHGIKKKVQPILHSIAVALIFRLSQYVKLKRQLKQQC